MYIYN